MMTARNTRTPPFGQIPWWTWIEIKQDCFWIWELKWKCLTKKVHRSSNVILHKLLILCSFSTTGDIFEIHQSSIHPESKVRWVVWLEEPAYSNLIGLSLVCQKYICGMYWRTWILFNFLNFPKNTMCLVNMLRKKSTYLKKKSFIVLLQMIIKKMKNICFCKNFLFCQPSYVPGWSFMDTHPALLYLTVDIQ